VALGSAGEDHELDYDDRNFVQHIVQLGLELHF
jgi:hypothetical protein